MHCDFYDSNAEYHTPHTATHSPKMRKSRRNTLTNSKKTPVPPQAPVNSPFGTLIPNSETTNEYQLREERIDEKTNATTKRSP